MPPPTGAPGRVLVIDDEPQVRTVFVRYLTLAGFDVLAAANGEEGLRLLREHSNIALVLLDFRMPQMNGLEFRQHQLADERIAGVPVVVVTGSPIGDEDLKRLKGVDHLLKPVPREVLIRVVGRYYRPSSQ